MIKNWLSAIPSVNILTDLLEIFYLFIVRSNDPFSYRVVIGYDEGTIMVKLGREVPVASMDNTGKIIWAKHNEIQTVNIKSVGADYEVWTY